MKQPPASACRKDLIRDAANERDLASTRGQLAAKRRSWSPGLRSLCWLGLLSCLPTLILIPTTRAADQLVRRSDNVTLRGEFTAMDPEAVRIKLSNGKEETIPVSDIRSVKFDQEPPLLSQAQSNERAGALAAALEKYQQVQGELAGADKRLAAEVGFLTARTLVKIALADPAGSEAAKKAIQEYRNSSKTSFRYLEATLLEATLLSSAGDTAAARTLLEEVRAAPVKGYQLQAGVQLGRLLLQSGDGTGAMQAFDEVVQQSANESASAGALFDGLLGKALCQQKQGQLKESLASLEDVLSKASESRVLAEAWIHKGDCLRQMNQPKDALMAYLHVDILYSSEPAEHAQALFRLSQLWGPAGHQDRAEDAAARLAEKYPNSAWAKQLRGA